MSDEINAYLIGGRRSGKWSAAQPQDILDQVIKARDDARANRHKIYPTVLTQDELDFLKTKIPSMSDWYDQNTVIITPMVEPIEVQFDVLEENKSAMERLMGNGLKQEPSGLNRADRRRLRHRKAR